MQNSNDARTILESTGVSKLFGGVQALDSVAFDLREGEVHALVGENGAGKSTYIKILSGLYQKDAGDITFCGEPYECESPVSARRMGVGLVPQHIDLAENLTVAENIFMGQYPRRRSGLVDWPELYRQAEQVATAFNMQDQVRTKVKMLSTGRRQMIEILRTLVFETKVVAFDEPTASLSEDETNALFEIIRNLKATGIGIIYVSHRLEELFQIADRVTVLKDGKYVMTADVKDIDKDMIISAMVGRDLDLFGSDTREHAPVETEILTVRNLISEPDVRDVSFSVRKHEILGLFGMVGSGRSETLMALFGAERKHSGTVLLNGEECVIRSPRDAVRLGLGLVPENRIAQGLILSASVARNITLPTIHRMRKHGLIDEKQEQRTATDYINTMRIKTPGPATHVVDLSGGNQQKISIAKWLAANCQLIFFDEPTHGIDVGAKHDIYQLMRSLADAGTGVVMVSSELPEIINVCDRILVFRDGQIVHEFDNREKVTEADVVEHALG